MNTYDVKLDGSFATEVGRVYGEVMDKHGRKWWHAKRIRGMEASGSLF